MTLFLDTSAFIARYFPRDQYHVPAMRAWASLAKTRVKLFTTDFVIAETMRAAASSASCTQAPPAHRRSDMSDLVATTNRSARTRTYGPAYRFAESLTPELGRQFAALVKSRTS